MNALNIYAIVAGGIFASFGVARAASSLTGWTKVLDVLFRQHLTLPFLLRRHRFFGPWSRGSVLLHLFYITVNFFLVFFRHNSLTAACHRAGALALINLIFLLSAIHLSFLADILGITLRSCKRVHRAVGWMTLALQAFHITVAILAFKVDFPIREPGNAAAVLVRLKSKETGQY